MPYSFGSFRLDESACKLWKGHEEIPLRRQSLQVLLHLVRNHGRLVRREELLDSVWGNVAVTSNALSQCLKDIRQVLGDDTSAPTYLQTRHRVGLEFIAEVRAEVQDWSSGGIPRGYPVGSAVAVLGFSTAGGDATEDWLGKGITHELLHSLGAWRLFPVLSPHTTLAFRREGRALQEVGIELGAAYIVEGHVQKDAEKITVYTHVSDTRNGQKLASHRYEGSLHSVPSMLDRAADEMARALYPELLRVASGRAARSSVKNLDAWERALRGLWHYYRATEHDSHEAIAHLGAAAHEDPTLTLATFHLGHARYLSLLYQWATDPEDAERGLRWAARTCLMNAPQEPWGHMLSGLCFVLDGDGERAIESMKIAISGNSSIAHARSLLGQLLALRGETAEGRAEVETALRLSPCDPRKGSFFTGMAIVEFVAGRYEHAIDWAERAIQHNPELVTGWLCVASSSGLLGRSKEAAQAVAAIRRFRPQFSHGLFQRLLEIASEESRALFWSGLQQAGVEAPLPAAGLR
jgi:TolB-like protein